MSISQKMVIFCFKKMMKAYFKAVILLIKTYENILKFNFLMEGNRHIDCLHKYFEAVIYRYKKHWRCRDFITTLKYLWIDINKREFTRRKMMKSWLYSRYTGGQLVKICYQILLVCFSYTVYSHGEQTMVPRIHLCWLIALASSLQGIVHLIYWWVVLPSQICLPYQDLNCQQGDLHHFIKSVSR